MNRKLATPEAINMLISSIAESIGWKYSESGRYIKKTVGDLLFEISFFSSKYNTSYERIEVNADFDIYYKKFGKLPASNVIAWVSYRSDKYWYDITTEKDLKRTFKILEKEIKNTAVDLCDHFETDYISAVNSLLNEHFYEYHVFFDFLADQLGISAIEQRAREIYEKASDETKRQIADYKNGKADKGWMIKRDNFRFIVDNDLIPNDK